MSHRNTILIISEYSDISTRKVFDYLNHLSSINVKIITPHEKVFIETIRVSVNRKKILLKCNNDVINFDNIRSVWYRRGFISSVPFPYDTIHKLEKQINTFLSTEWEKITSFLLSISQLEPGIFLLGSFEHERHCNKLINLHIASSIGLTIPETFITSDRLSLLNFSDDYELLATKPVSNVPIFSLGMKIYSGGGTNVLTKSDIKDLPQQFFPVLVQEYIDKLYEIRVLFLKGDLYAMAIFSQGNERTKIDYRNYDIDEPNRLTPIELPQSIQVKIREFMNKLSLNFGSIDLIYSKEGKYVFLEVNPSGQFDWLSFNCNYNLEKRIAKILLNET
ncbi:grasp-with-spasm system ATP-grasp peptide maturase [Chitinophaga varians]|uniref:grasp-with-spasm system ATP-grasp peptide maturase n=1 Tax=Chitinophaga varians TaxID=2202339 RepID=UPI00165F9A98|nr:grasp-with-spasm system ATP-grasp peptide maturase [Chitinophaga varians]MBC9909091.1 grasp-with-spasm system ATP-grasp peptide maturase [Chitinophaga varians]